MLSPVKAPTAEIYATLSICPRCFLVDKKGLTPIKASVIEISSKIWLKALCPTHGPQHTLICSDPAFFRRAIEYVKPTVKPIADIEELNKRLRPSADALPLLAELSILRNQQFLTDEQILEHIHRIKAMYPPGRRFVLRASSRVATDLETMNQKLHLILSQLTNREPMLVNSTFDRIEYLSQLENSIFLKPRVYPCLKYFLRRGDESLCRAELAQMMQSIKDFSGIKAVISIVLEKPYADIRDLLAYIRENHRWIRVVEFSLERSPRAIREALALASNPPQAAATATTAPPQPNTYRKTEDGEFYEGTMDAMEAMYYLSHSCDNSISPGDFFPVAMGSVLEPFLDLLGAGKYSIRPSPHCGFGVCLVNTAEVKSVPFTRYIDFARFYKEMQPLLPKIIQDGIGFWTARSIKKLLGKCALQQMPDLFDYMTDKNKAELVSQFIDDVQFLIVHAQMDAASIDVVRRCSCAAVSTETDCFVASCNGCL